MVVREETKNIFILAQVKFINNALIFPFPFYFYRFTGLCNRASKQISSPQISTKEATERLQKTSLQGHLQLIGRHPLGAGIFTSGRGFSLVKIPKTKCNYN